MPNEVAMTRGDVVVAFFGRDYGKPRPAIVVQSDGFNRTHASVVLCPITSDLMRAGIFRVPLSPSVENGLREESEIMVDKLGAVEKPKVRQRIGHLTAFQ